MHRKSPQSEPASPGAAAALSAALDASDFSMTSIFVQARGLADPETLADAVAITRSKPPRPHPAPAEHEPVHPESAFTDEMRARLDEINKRLLNLGTCLDRVDLNMALAINEHLDAIGL